jgi:hypothetical protein
VTTDPAKVALFEKIAHNSSRAFWRALGQRFDWAYRESYHVVINERSLPLQTGAKLLDERFYLVETAFDEAAREGAAISSGQSVEINGWNYTVIRAGELFLMPHFVHGRRCFARSAKLREKHAAINAFLREQELPFGDVPPEIFAPASVAAIILHGPVGKAFEEEQQKLGFLNFAVPRPDHSEWAMNLPVAEIVAYFDSLADSPDKSQRDIARPSRKEQKRRGESGDS